MCYFKLIFPESSVITSIDRFNRKLIVFTRMYDIGLKILLSVILFYLYGSMADSGSVFNTLIGIKHIFLKKIVKNFVHLAMLVDLHITHALF